MFQRGEVSHSFLDHIICVAKWQIFHLRFPKFDYFENESIQIQFMNIHVHVSIVSLFCWFLIICQQKTIINSLLLIVLTITSCSFLPDLNHYMLAFVVCCRWTLRARPSSWRRVTIKMWPSRWKSLWVLMGYLWPSNAMWRPKSGSTLAEVMAWCLTAPSHYLNRCWLIQ